MPEAVIALTTLCLALSFLAIGRRGEGSPRLFLAAWAVAALLFIANAWLAQAPPFGNMRHVLCVFPLLMPLADLYLRKWRKMQLTAWLAGATSLALLGALCMPLQATWRQMPALQSPWFAPHVTSYVLSYGLMTVAALLALKSLRDADPEARLGQADAIVRLAFPFMTFGLWSGALWADAAWGGYWAWDIKEVWSLLTWTIYLLYFHAAGKSELAGWRRPLLLLGWAAVIVTFLVVNLLPKLESLHSYAQ